jgi:hypothetical protein
MSDRELDQIMNDVLDGVATSEQAAWLEKRLAADPAARERFDRHSRLFRVLEVKGAMVEAPGDLAPAILGEVRRLPRPARAAIGSWVREAFGRRRRLGWAYAIGACAALVALAVMTRIDRQALGVRGWLPATGTMAPAGPGQSGAPINQASITAGSSKARVELFKQGEGLLVRIETHSAQPLGVELEYDPAAISAAKFEGPNDLEYHQTSPGHLEFTPSGNVMTRVHLAVSRGGDTQVRVTLQSEGIISRAILHTGSGADARP